MMTYYFECAACGHEMTALVGRAPAWEFVEGEEYDAADTIITMNVPERCPQCGEPLEAGGAFLARHADIIDDLLSDEEEES